ncbi:MAG TPA: beta-ketoacyl synthase N-terminal-like domain-containing protein [Candidatus Binatia bacterium]|nr:beta-ketoacyl synthase N-terminal-like domain-containing protein [Candidatus Binatia bacterium]
MSNAELADDERYVITGYETVTPLGLDKVTSWQNLVSGQHGLRHVSETHLAKHEELGIMKSQVVGALPNEFEATLRAEPILMNDTYNYKELVRYSHLSAQVAGLVVHRAMREAGVLQADSSKLNPEIVDPYRTDLYIGSTFAGVSTLAEFDPQNVRATDLFKTLFGRVASVPANIADIRRRAVVVDVECASGSITFDMAVDALQKKVKGDYAVDLVVAAGVDAGLPPRGVEMFEGMGEEGVDTRDDPEVVSRPFDKNRHGLVMGEGGGAFVIERLSSAKARGLTDEQIIAELVATRSYTHAESRVQAGLEGAQRGLEELIEASGLTAEELLYINNHATSTGVGDTNEAKITKLAVASRNLAPQKVYANSTKGATGHALGGAGAIEAGFAIEALLHGETPPGLKLTEPEEDMAHFNLSALESTKADLDVVISISLGFGGSFAGIALRKYVGR